MISQTCPWPNIGSEWRSDDLAQQSRMNSGVFTVTLRIDPSQPSRSRPSLPSFTAGFGASRICARSWAKLAASTAFTDRASPRQAVTAEEQSSVSAEIARSLSAITASLQREGVDVGQINDLVRSVNTTMGRQIFTISQRDPEKVFFESVKADHLLWKARLADVVHGDANMKTLELIDHTQCGLGRWYYGDGKARFTDLRTFSKLEAVHARVHDIGRGIAKSRAKVSCDAMLDLYRELEPEGQRQFALID